MPETRLPSRPSQVDPITGKPIVITGTPGAVYGGVAGGIYSDGGGTTYPPSRGGGRPRLPLPGRPPIISPPRGGGRPPIPDGPNPPGGRPPVPDGPLPPAGWNGQATDFSSLMSGLNSLNPGDINIDSTATGFTNTILSDYGQNTANALQYLQQSGQQGVQGYQQVFNTLQGGVADYLKNINQGAQSELGGVQGTLDYYKTLANRNLPGQSLMEQNIQGTAAQAVNKVREFGGSSQGALGAITDIYGQQQNALRDVGLANAQFQSQNQNALAGYMGTVGAQRAGVYNRMGEAAMQGAQTTAEGQQLLTNAQQGASANVANFYQGLAPQSATLLQNMLQQRLAAEQQQADLARRSILDTAQITGQGLQAAGQAQDQSFYYNQLMPLQQATNFYNGMMGTGGQGGELLGAAQGMYNTNAGLYSQGQQAWGNALGAVGGSIANIGGQYLLQNIGQWGTNAAAQGITQAGLSAAQAASYIH